MAVWTGWDPLQDILVSDCYLGELNPPIDSSVRSDYNTILRETKEDLDNLSNYLTKLGVTVHRPKFRYIPTAPIVPVRDQYHVYGNTIYQTYTSIKNRYFDSLNYYEVFQKFFRASSYNWISQPIPPLDSLNTSENNTKWWKNGRQIYNSLSENILWHTATAFNCGDSLIINHDGPGTSDGLRWFKRNLPPNTKVYRNNSKIWNNWGHIDHGWFMTDDNTVFCKSTEWVPPCLRDKNLIEFKEEYNLDGRAGNLIKAHTDNETEWIQNYIAQFTGYDQEVHFDSNVLVVDPHNVIFSEEIPSMFDAMDKLNIRCHTVHQRHSGFWEGGIHCMTNELSRDGERRKIVL
jgi:hypothetical protein